MLVELGLVEQRLMAVREVLDGATVTDVAKRNGVTRQTVHTWLRSYANFGVAGLVDKSSKPETCPAPDDPGGRSPDRRDAAQPSEMGTEVHPHPPGPGRSHTAARSVVDLSGPGPSPPDRADPTQAVPVGLQAVGAVQVHGALADGHRGSLLSGRRHRGEGGHRRRRPQPLLRLCPHRGPSDSQAGV